MHKEDILTKCLLDYEHLPYPGYLKPPAQEFLHL